MITEPMTMATDYLVASFSLVWGVLLWRGAGQRSVAARWWATGFFAAAVAALAGGTVHGFRHALGSGLEAALWRSTLWAIGAFAFCAVATALTAGASRRLRKAGLVTAAVLVAVYAVLVAARPLFLYAILAYAPALLVLGGQQLHAWRSRGAPSAPWILGGILVSFAAAVIQRSGLDLHRHFNHNDLYHVVQLGGGYLFYHGGKLLGRRVDWP